MPLGAKFADVRHPRLRFPSYRHWQRGLVKMKGAKSVLRLLTLMREGDDGECDRELEDDNVLNSAALTQAGHSIKTAFGGMHSHPHRGKFASAESSRIEGFRMASQEWHVDIGRGDCGRGQGQGQQLKIHQNNRRLTKAQQ